MFIKEMKYTIYRESVRLTNTFFKKFNKAIKVLAFSDYLFI